MTWHLIDDPDNQPPKDGTAVLLSDSFDANVGRFEYGSWVGLIDGAPVYDALGYPKAVTPTHWMPLPLPPATQEIE